MLGPRIKARCAPEREARAVCLHCRGVRYPCNEGPLYYFCYALLGGVGQGFYFCSSLVVVAFVSVRGVGCFGALCLHALKYMQAHPRLGAWAACRAFARGRV